MSYSFYITVAGIVSSVFSIVGLILYQVFLRNWTFRKVVLFTTLLEGVGSLTDFFVVMRWTKVLGIPDWAAVLFGDSVIRPMTEMLNWVPGSVLIAKVCPPGLESSVYALLAGFSNLGLQGANLIGSLLLQLFGVKTSLPCSFIALPWLILACYVILPIVVGVACALLIVPNTSQNDKIN